MIAPRARGLLLLSLAAFLLCCLLLAVTLLSAALLSGGVSALHTLTAVRSTLLAGFSGLSILLVASLAILGAAALAVLLVAALSVLVACLTVLLVTALGIHRGTSLSCILGASYLLTLALLCSFGGRAERTFLAVALLRLTRATCCLLSSIGLRLGFLLDRVLLLWGLCRSAYAEGKEACYGENESLHDCFC